MCHSNAFWCIFDIYTMRVSEKPRVTHTWIHSPPSLHILAGKHNGPPLKLASALFMATLQHSGLDGMAAISCSRPEHMAVNCLLSWKILQNFIKFISKQAAIVLRPVYSNTAQLESSCVGEVSIATTTQLNWPASRWLAVRCNWVSCIADRRRQLSCVGEGVYSDATQLNSTSSWVVSL